MEAIPLECAVSPKTYLIVKALLGVETAALLWYEGPAQVLIGLDPD